MKKMKSLKEIVNKYTPEEIAESFVLESELESTQKAEALIIFQKWRRKNESARSGKSKLTTKLLQLKFEMEDYIKRYENRTDLDFSYFLSQYIERLEIKKKDFAREISVDPTELSQIINRHRSPGEKFIIRLEIHSNNNFPAVIWFRIIEKQKAFQLQNNASLRESETKHVKHKLDFTF